MIMAVIASWFVYRYLAPKSWREWVGAPGLFLSTGAIAPAVVRRDAHDGRFDSVLRYTEQNSPAALIAPPPTSPACSSPHRRCADQGVQGRFQEHCLTHEYTRPNPAPPCFWGSRYPIDLPSPGAHHGDIDAIFRRGSNSHHHPGRLAFVTTCQSVPAAIGQVGRIRHQCIASADGVILPNRNHGV